MSASLKVGLIGKLVKDQTYRNYLNQKLAFISQLLI
jgi:hypothetical protein